MINLVIDADIIRNRIEQNLSINASNTARREQKCYWQGYIHALYEYGCMDYETFVDLRGFIIDWRYA